MTTVFVKTRRGAPPGYFAAEAAGLAWLGAAPGGVPVPAVLAVTDESLTLERLLPTTPTAAAAEELGRRLAATHAAGAPSFGGDRDGWIGTLPLPNARGADWPSWYAAHRVLPYVAALDRDDRAAVEALVERIAEAAGPPEPPSRIHGDLWTGNVVFAGEAYLIDPAAHGGHRETDLAMLALFGAPFLDRIVAAYDEVAPLADGWRERVPLHQVHPLVVHAAMFGGGYGRQAANAARQALTP